MSKKITAIILSILMAFSLMSVAVSAAENIVPYERISVTASSENNPTFRFVTEETKTLIVTSYASDDVDPYVLIENESDTYLLDDSADSTNFAEKYEFEAGVEYYLTICTYSDEEATFDIALECDHEWDDDTCADCGKVCEHDAENSRFKICECGNVSKTTVIELGETVDVAINGFDPVVRKFVPEEDVAAILYSDVFINDTMYDASAAIFDAEGNELAYNDDFNGSFNFVIWYEFEAGETYFIEVATYYEDLSFEFSLVKAAHTADDGVEHDVVYTDYHSGTCQDLCYTEGLYCAECDMYFAGHFEDGYGFCWDEDEDGYCDVCSKGMDGSEAPDDTEDTDGADNDSINGLPSISIIDILSDFVKYIKNFVLKILKFYASL